MKDYNIRNVAVVTGTRADYGLLKNIMTKIKEDDSLNLQIIVTGSHLSEEFGMTVEEIITDGFLITTSCPILLDYNGVDKNAKEMSLAISQFSTAFLNLQPNIILILGDRYEIFAAAITGTLMNIPIAHISGGEETEGAMDNQIRHSITKLAHLHFPGAEVYKDKIISMGEEPWRVFNVGDPGVENIRDIKFISKDELKKDLGIEINRNTILATFHPVTLEIDSLESQVNNFIKAIDKITRELNTTVIITYPNADYGGRIIINKLIEFKNNNNNIYLYKSLGLRRYLSVMKLCGAVVGNSSSAIVEAPILKKPVVNIGTRQQGRLMADNIISTSYDVNEIVDSIKKALTIDFAEKCNKVTSIYGEGYTSNYIVDILKHIPLDNKLLMKKSV